MDRDSMARLRLDRRLIRRRGWIPEEELRRELEALPDISHKVAPPERSGSRPGASGEQPEAEGTGSAPETTFGDSR